MASQKDAPLSEPADSRIKRIGELAVSEDSEHWRMHDSDADALFLIGQISELQSTVHRLEAEKGELRRTFEISSTDEENRLRAENESLKAQLTALSPVVCKCPGCHYYDYGAKEMCPYCGTSMRATPEPEKQS